MASYNLVNGKKATLNKHLLTDILRSDFGFKGFVLSDWWAMPPGYASSGNPDQLKANAIDAVNAGLDMELPWSLNFQQLEAVTGAGSPLQQTQLSASASRIVEQKFRFNVAKIGSQIGLQTPKTSIDSSGSIQNDADHIALAHRAALESMVLLKNDSNTLPIKRANVHTIAVLGQTVSYSVVNTDHDTGSVNFATDPRLGDLGSSRVFGDPAKSSAPYDGIKAVAGGGINVVSGADASVAQNADFIVVVAGLTPQDEGEEYTGAGDRNNFALDGKSGTNAQNTLITDAANLHKPMVVVLEGGSVIDMPWLSSVPAVVMAWYPGMDGGRALGELLFEGGPSFSGKLPVSWPKSWNDEPTFNAGPTTNMDYYVGYHWFDHKGTAPLYAFGAGLSYTKFDYKYLTIPCTDVTKGGVVNITTDITNSGSVKGDEVAFLFVSYPGTKQRRPDKELKGFHRVSLDPGQTKRISFALRVSDLSYWDTGSSSWQIESGQVQVMVGPSSDNLPLKDTLTVK
jgi:beta-glucosidase